MPIQTKNNKYHVQTHHLYTAKHQHINTNIYIDKDRNNKQRNKGQHTNGKQHNIYIRTKQYTTQTVLYICEDKTNNHQNIET